MRALPYIAVAFLCVPLLLYAQVRQSNNYQILFDTLDSGGGLGTSSNYILESSVGEQATGDSTSTNYMVSAGYQQAETNLGGGSISLSAPSDVTLAPISGLTGGTSKNTAAWTVITDSTGGYVLTIEATSTPAFRAPSGASFSNYVPTTSAPDFNFSVNAASSTFGFSPEGTHIVNRFKDDGSSTCNTGSSDTADRCYDAVTTTPMNIASSNSANSPTGTVTTVRFAAGVGSSKIQDSGSYTATVIVTAIAQ